MVARDGERPEARHDVEADGVPRFPEVGPAVGDDVDGERDARAEKVHAEDGGARAVARLERAVDEERVRERVLDLGEAALALAAAVPDYREHAHGALQHGQLEHGRVAHERDGDARQQREVRPDLRVGPRPRAQRAAGVRLEGGTHRTGSARV